MEEIKRGDKHVVHLWDCQKANIIVAAPTGVIYTNQCGGTMCSHPELEGFLVPMRWIDEDALYKLLMDFWFPVGAWDDPHYGPILKKMRAELVRLVAEEFTTSINGRMTFDEERSNTLEWGEAWIPVTADYGPGILTWENSD